MTEPTIQQLFDLTGRVALITGGSGYLGRSLSRALAEAGATVVVASRDGVRAQQVAGELPAPGGALHRGVELDQLNEESLNRGFDAAVSTAGQVDILINNGQQGHPLDLTNVTAEAFNKDLQNATGYFLLARRLHDHAIERQSSGAIVMVGSMYGVVGSYPDAYAGVCTASPVQYHALKGGIVHMTRHLAVYWAKDGVRVNCLSPGPFPNEKAPPEMVARLQGKSPLGRMGAPHELKGALLLLTSDAGSYITGQNLLVDGGWTAW
ncbi:MAG: SDR family oxidoreductase [Planctomycetaceae bacterium]|nr:SDR family oxidoreductase [Planctomycetaceae bacterium]